MYNIIIEDDEMTVFLSNIQKQKYTFLKLIFYSNFKEVIHWK